MSEERTMKTIAIIAARTGSSRLPGKVLLPLLGHPMLGRMIERVGHARLVDEILVATSTLPEDDRIEELANELGVRCFRGSPDDVLGRISAAATWLAADVVVELLGDNPLVHSELIDDVIRLHREGTWDYVANVTNEYPHAPAEARRFPVGLRVQVFETAVLEECERQALSPEYREHSTSFIYESPERFAAGYLEATGKWSDFNRPDLTFAVNYRENLELVSNIFEACYPIDPNFDLRAAIGAFDRFPSWATLMGVPSDLVTGS